MQNKAGRIITGDSYDSSATNTRLKLGWKDLSTIRDEKLLRLVKKILTGKSDLDNLVGLFSLNNREGYNLRSNNCTLSLPKPKTNALKKSFGYRGSVIWNDQPIQQRLSSLGLTTPSNM